MSVVIGLSDPLDPPASAQGAVDTNVVYAMDHGLALLMDVHRPARPNGHGILCVYGSGWHAPSGDATSDLKADKWGLKFEVDPLVGAGYTVFVVNHRSAPKFRYPVPLEDVQRAARFIRYHAARFGINPDRIGGVGDSSGGHLVAMLGVSDGAERADGADPVDQTSARLQAVVALFAPHDLTQSLPNDFALLVGSFLGTPIRRENAASIAYQTYVQASPVSHVTRDDAPMLLIHGDRDQQVPFNQSEVMEAALKRAEVPTRLIRVPGGGHMFTPQPGYPDYMREMVGWFDHYLRRRPEP